MKTIFSTIIALFTCLLAEAAPSFVFRSYTSESGLSSNIARAVAQDNRGLIWLGTSDGLDSFDGREFFHHDYPKETGRYTNCLLISNDGNVWAGGVGFLICASRGKTIDIGAEVTALAEDMEGDIWGSTRGKGIFRYSGKDDRISFYTEDEEYESIFVDSRGIVLASSTRGHEVRTYNRVTDSFSGPSVVFENCEPSRISGFYEDATGDIWAGTWDKGLYRYDRNTRTLTRAPGNTSVILHIHKIAKYQLNLILICADNGLFVYDITNGSVVDAECRDFIYDVMRDREGGTWVCSYYGGVSYSPPSADQFMHIRPEGNAEYVISRIAESQDGTLWIGSDNGGLFHYSATEKKFIGHYLPDKNIHALLPDGDRLWIGSYSGGLDLLDMKSGRIGSLSRSGSFYSIFKDSRGTIWASSMDSIYQYDSDSGSLKEVYQTGSEIYDTAEDKDGRVWFASDRGGLFCYDPATGNWDNIMKSSSGLPSNCILSLYISDDGRVWAGTDEGLCYRAAGSEVFTKVGINAERIYHVTSDGQQLWVFTEKGIVKLFPDLRMENYGQDNGLASMHFMPSSGLRASDGRIYIGTTDGITSFLPTDIMYNSYVPPVLVTRVNVYGKSRRNDKEPTKSYETFDPDAGPIHLKHNRNHIVFTFAGLSYCAPEENSYRYLLEGLDNQWTECEGSPRAEYTNLHAGHYLFRVKAANNDGVMNATDGIVEFTIQRHPLMSGVAIAVYICLLMLALLYAARYMRRHVEVLSEERFNDKVKEFEEEKRQQQENDFEHKLERIIHDNIGNTELSAELIAKELCVSRSGLFAKVKESTGKTPHQLILEARLAEACRLLEEHKTSIADISMMVGFNSTSYFSKCFAKETGMSPAEWQKNHL